MESSKPLGFLSCITGSWSGYFSVSLASNVTHTYCLSTSFAVEGNIVVLTRSAQPLQNYKIKINI